MTDPVAEIAAEGWASLLRGRSLMQWIDMAPGPAPAFARRAIQEATSSQPLWITIGTIDESGDPIEFTLGGQDVLEDCLPKLADEGNMDWLVDADRVFHAGRRLGRDRSAQVRFSEGREIVSANIGNIASAPDPEETFELITAEQQVIQTGGSSGSRWVLAGLPSSTLWRPYIEPVYTTFEFSGSRSVFTVPPWLPTHPMELVIADVDDAWAQCDLGDTIRLVIASHPFGSGTFRILGRAYDATTNVLTVAGEGLSDVEAAA